mgnify:FL=1
MTWKDILKADTQDVLKKLIGEKGRLDDIVEVINKKFDVRNFDPDARGSHYKTIDSVEGDVIRFGLPIDVFCVPIGENKSGKMQFEVKKVYVAQDDIKKAEEKMHCGTHKLDEKMLYGGQKKLDKDKDGKLTGKDFAMLRNERTKKSMFDKDPEEMTDFMNVSPRMKRQKMMRQILREIKKEGGALGMKNLKKFGKESEIKSVLAEMEKEGKIFMHKDGDIYTHKPE